MSEFGVSMCEKYAQRNSLLRGKISLFDIRTKVDLLRGHQDEVNKGDKPPNQRPDYEPILFEKPAIEHHVSNLDMVDLSDLGPS